jgi:carbonic anhydrase
MSRWRDSLRAYRRRSLEGDGAKEPGDVMFVLCSENAAAAPLVAACEPAIVLQTFGGARTPADTTTRATIEYAVKQKGVRHIVVCGHEGCHAVRPRGASARAATQADAAAQAADLRRDQQIGALLRAHGVMVRALWLDEAEGDIYACDIEGRPPSLMDDEDFARMLESFQARPA